MIVVVELHDLRGDSVAGSSLESGAFTASHSSSDATIGSALKEALRTVEAGREEIDAFWIENRNGKENEKKNEKRK